MEFLCQFKLKWTLVASFVTNGSETSLALNLHERSVDFVRANNNRDLTVLQTLCWKILHSTVLCAVIWQGHRDDSCQCTGLQKVLELTYPEKSWMVLIGFKEFSVKLSPHICKGITKFRSGIEGRLKCSMMGSGGFTWLGKL